MTHACTVCLTVFVLFACEPSLCALFFADFHQKTKDVFLTTLSSAEESSFCTVEADALLSVTHYYTVCVKKSSPPPPRLFAIFSLVVHLCN